MQIAGKNSNYGDAFETDMNICLEFADSFATRDVPQEILDKVSVDERSLVFKKELMPVGVFKKDGYVWNVTEPLLQHWKRTEDHFQEKGIQTPVPIEHSFDPQANRGESLGMVVEKNPKGVPALFAFIKFADAEAAKLAKTVNCSVFCPPEWTDGLGESYVRPIKHIALTNYPVIPGLSKFQAIAASFNSGEPDMSIIAVAQQLGIQNPEQMQPEQLMASVTAAVKGLMDKVRTSEDSPGEQTTQQHPSPGASPAPPVAAPAPPVAAAVIKPFAPPTPPTHGLMRKEYPPALMASFKNLVRGNRTAKIDALAAAGNITPATAVDLKALFVRDEALDLAFSSAMEDCDCEDGKEASDDEFDGLIDGLKKNKAVEFSEKTGPQGGVAKLAVQKASSPLVADAEARRKQLQNN